MSRWLKKIQAWRSRRQLRSLQWWERQRANGKTRFVVRWGLAYGLTVIGAQDVFDNIFRGATQDAEFFWCGTIYWPVCGIIIASSTWSNWEAKYQKALHEGVKAPPGDKTLPNSKT